MKKLLALLMVMVTLLCALIGCVELEQPQIPQDQTSTEEESTALAYLDAVPEDLKFNKEDIVILSIPYL